MNHRVHALLVFALVAAGVTAQTTGVVGVNNLQVAMPPSLPFPVGSNPINGGGQTSCFNTGLHSPVNAGWLHYQLSVTPSTTGAILVLGFCNCGGTSNIPFFPTQTVACAGPITGGTNLWLSIDVSPGCFATASGFASPGFFNWRFPIAPGTPLGLTVWAQALIFDPPCVTGWPFKFSQAVGIS